MMQQQLSAQKVIVTGAASGLGSSIAERILQAGARVHICDIDAARLQEFSAKWPGAGTTLADVSKPEDVGRLFQEALTGLGGLTALVNNVGVAGPIGSVETLPLDAWSAAISINLTGTLLCIQKAVPALRLSGGGSIINMSSVAGRAGFPLRASYCSTKSALLGLTRAAALDLGRHNIRVNAVLPGACDTERLDSVLRTRSQVEGRSYESLWKETEEICALQRVLEPDEVAGTVSFLISHDARGITGQAISVCGGAKL
jgi:NAD(P)-dependent dehydrogenase (short-subunit alcohol dehydrogenase family)